jgi:hypothetical protein
MAHRPDTQRGLPVKTKLILIAIMFVVITLVFEYGFDSSDESEKQVEFDEQNQLKIDKNAEFEEEMNISLLP